MFKKFYLLFILILALSFSFSFANCPEGHFRDIQGPINVEFGQRHTYSVVADGSFQYVRWSIHGGQVAREYNRGNTFFCDIIWNERNAEEYRVKVYGEDGCNIMRDKRLYINIKGHSPQLDPQPSSSPATQKRLSPSDSRQIAESLMRYYQRQSGDRAFDDAIKNQLIRSLTNKMNNDEAVDILWNQGIKPAMIKSLDMIAQNAVRMEDRDMIKRTVKQEARTLLKKFYLNKNIDENLLERWVDILARSRNPKVTQAQEFQTNLANGASDLAVSHLRQAGIIPRLVNTSRN